MTYHVLGLLSSLLFLMTWYGLFKQIQVIQRRLDMNEPSTRNLSINQFGSSYLAFYANFIFGIALITFNHYLVWTRLGALVLLLYILYRIWQDRPTTINQSVFVVSALMLLLGFVSIGFRPYPGIAQLSSTILMLVVTGLLIQGTVHQCWLLIKTKEVGDLSGALFKSILIKDISTLAFALTIPLNESWPLLLLNGSSVITRGWLLWLIRKYDRSI